MATTSSRWKWLVPALAGLLAYPEDAPAVEPSVAQEAVILVKVLGYDRSAAGDVRVPVVVAVIDGLGTPAERRTCADQAEALELAAATMTVQRRPLAIRRLVWTDAVALGAALARDPVDALFVCDGLRDEAPQIAAVARGAGVLTATSRRDVAEASLALGIVRVGAKVEIVVNLPVAKAEGAQLSADLLQLATVVR